MLAVRFELLPTPANPVVGHVWVSPLDVSAVIEKQFPVVNGPGGIDPRDGILAADIVLTCGRVLTVYDPDRKTAKDVFDCPSDLRTLGEAPMGAGRLR